LDEFVIEVSEFLEAVVVLEEFLDCAVLVPEELLDRGAALTPVRAPESAVKKSKETGLAY
jgi:hypothetical protein